MGYVIITKKTGKRVVHNNKLIPYMPYAAQADRFIARQLNGRRDVTYIKVGEHK